jgi:hypothetical protein
VGGRRIRLCHDVSLGYKQRSGMELHGVQGEVVTCERECARSWTRSMDGPSWLAVLRVLGR